MKITMFNGSPRGRGSNTNVIVRAFLEGAAEAGAETENVFLIEKKIEHCTGCFSCWFKTPGQCVHHDDMAALLSLYKDSDVVGFATPVYLWNVTACTKNFLDRLIPLKCPVVVEHNGTCDMQNISERMPDILVFANAGFPGDGNFETMRAVMKSAAPVLEIYRNCGMLLQSRDERVRAKVRQYLDVVRRAGAGFARHRALPETLLSALNRELMPIGEYVKYIGGQPFEIDEAY